ncbi:MAG: TIGR04282 family arsenosugar biosynthesis glycosyltransferase [Sediminicola sp.]
MERPEKENLLLIFTRNPELGKCKTRLAAAVGDRAALDIYRFLLDHTQLITKSVDAKKEVYYSEEIWEEDIWDRKYYEKQLQNGEDLGERMLNAFKHGFEAGYRRIVIIGSDMYDLSTQDLDHAFQQLHSHDYVIGPASDGGYYLLGMNRLCTSVFARKAWGTKTVLEDTLRDLKNKNTKLLKIKNDVDLYADIANVAAFQPFLKHLKK